MDHTVVQLYFRVDTLGEEGYALLQKLDIGDIVGVTGKISERAAGNQRGGSDPEILIEVLRCRQMAWPQDVTTLPSALC